MNESRPTWLGVVLDLPAASHEEALAFWAAVSGSTVPPRRGRHDDLTALVPGDGDDHLRVQRVGDGPARLHLDLHSPDPRTTAAVAVGLGAEEVADRGAVVLRSPGGLTVCCRPAPARRPRVPGVRTWPGGHRSRVDQVCLDLPESAWVTEPAFWSALLGVPVLAPFPRDEFSRIDAPGLGMRVLLQRLDERGGPVRAHLDLAADDREAETDRHLGLGARLESREQWWTVLRDPAGLRYCITDRDPDESAQALS